MNEDSIDAVFLTSPISMGYFHGFREEGHERFLSLAVRSSGDVHLIAPSLSENQARRAGIESISTWADGQDPMERAKTLAKEWDLRAGVIAVEPDMLAEHVLQLQSALPAALFRSGRSLLEELMRSKDADEMKSLRAAAKIADDATPDAYAAAKAGASELEVDQAIRKAMSTRGGPPTFCIVAAGAGSAEPHHGSADVALKSGDVVVLDFGCSSEGYQSDITRTVCVGPASDEAKKVYEIVLQAHQAAAEAARAGVTSHEVDAAARSVIEKAGYGPRFVHRTGHGIGQRVHEAPNIISGSGVILAEGDCFSIEPGIYIEGKFGVRIENIYTIEGGRAVSLNAPPPSELLEL